MYNKKIATRYAKAFIHDDMDKKEIDILIEELHSFSNAMESNEIFKKFLIIPVTPKEMKLKIIRDLWGKIGFSAHTLSLLEILIKNDRMDIISEILQQIQEILDIKYGIIRVKVTTAHEPSVKDIEELTQRISGFFGSNAVVKRFIDKSIIGGFTIEGDGKLIDISVKGQIEKALSDI